MERKSLKSKEKEETLNEEIKEILHVLLKPYDGHVIFELWYEFCSTWIRATCLVKFMNLTEFDRKT